MENLRVIRDQLSGSSKGYSFVKYADVAVAAQAIAHMNGYWLEGKIFIVRVVGHLPPPPPNPPGAPRRAPLLGMDNSMGGGGGSYGPPP